jgi:hypothetical protein
VLRHRDPKLTEVYGHLETNYLRAEVNRLELEGMPIPEAPRRRGAVGRVTPVLPTSPKTSKGPELRGKKPSISDPLHPVGETGFEPATPWSRRAVEDFQGVRGRPSLRKLSGS